MKILNIASYHFIKLDALPELQKRLQNQCVTLSLKGTILLGQEGINLSLAGATAAVIAFKQYLTSDERFAAMTFRESTSDYLPFDRLKVKIKDEIITMHCPEIHPEEQQAPSISPQQFCQWQDEKRDMIILDTRNDYEVRFGTFNNAVNLQLQDFSEFPEASAKLDNDKPIVMFCTGGIRCEKAALQLIKTGHREVYQLQGGILNYFKEVGGTHFSGDCFVFDQRIALDANLQETGAKQCSICQGPVSCNKDVARGFVANLVCNDCTIEKGNDHGFRAY